MEKKDSPLSEYIITGVIDHFENIHAVIIMQDKQTLFWPIKNLPDNIKEGEIIKLKLITDKAETQNQEQAVKNLINQILQK